MLTQQGSTSFWPSLVISPELFTLYTSFSSIDPTKSTRCDRPFSTHPWIATHTHNAPIIEYLRPFTCHSTHRIWPSLSHEVFCSFLPTLLQTQVHVAITLNDLGSTPQIVWSTVPQPRVLHCFRVFIPDDFSFYSLMICLSISSPSLSGLFGRVDSLDQ